MSVTGHRVQAVGEPPLEDTPHCVCLCIPCRSASDPATMDAMRDLLTLARGRGAPTHSVSVSASPLATDKWLHFACSLQHEAAEVAGSMVALLI